MQNPPLIKIKIPKKELIFYFIIAKFKIFIKFALINQKADYT